MRNEVAMAFPDVEAEVRRLARENPYFEYPSGACNYNATPLKPACLFGRALTNLGYTIPDTWEGLPITKVLYRLGMRPWPWQNEWSVSVQFHQDNGVPWGTAVEKADKELGLS